MKSIKILLIVIATITSSCFAMEARRNFRLGPNAGWTLRRIPIACAGAEITSFAMGTNSTPWITTRDGRILRFRENQWQDVSNIFSPVTGAAAAAPMITRFKYVFASPGTDNVEAIDEEGKIYYWRDI